MSETIETTTDTTVEATGSVDIATGTGTTAAPPAPRVMGEPYHPTADVHVLPTTLPLPGLGMLPINAYVLHADEPVLVDAGVGIAGDDFMEALASVVAPEALRWIWLTHDDADHTGNLQRVMEAAPQARLVTHGIGTLRMSSWWPVPFPFDRVHAIRPGDRLAVGDRTLRAVSPPLFDNPMSMGILDEATGALFSADSFGALLPAPAEDAVAVPEDALRAGMQLWAAHDSPWVHSVDRSRFAEALDGVRRLQPSAIFSSHLPYAGGTSLEPFLQVLASVADTTPVVPPSREEFDQMIAAIAAMQAGTA